MAKVELEPMILASTFNGFKEFALEKQLDLEAMLEHADLDDVDLVTYDHHISLNKFSEALEFASRKTGDRFFGLHYGEFYKPGSSGAFGYVLLNSPTVRDALNNIVRYMNIFVTIRNIEFIEENGVGTLIWSYPFNFHPRSQYVDLAITFVLERLRLGAGKDWMPLSVQIEHKGSVDQSEYVRVFGKRITFNGKDNRITLDATALNAKMPDADHMLYHVIKNFCGRLIQERGHEGRLARRLRIAIVEGLSQGKSTLEDIAGIAGLSVSIIRKDLDELGTTYQYILNDTRFSLADYYLRDTNLPLTEIALLLGFSELSAFTRASKRWFEMSPKAYRKIRSAS